MSNAPTISTPVGLVVHFEGDWHVGTGTGEPGGLDRSTSRDPRGIPQVPASTLTGILRDRCELVAHALDSRSPGPWLAWVRWLFGGLDPSGSQPPRRAVLRVTPARVSSALADRVVEEGLVDHTVTVRHSTAIERDTGVAKDHTLRSIELGRRGTPLHARITSTVDPLPPEAAFLLAAAVHLTERLGGKRRRGLGRCRLTLERVDRAVMGEWAIWASGLGRPADPPRLPEQATTLTGSAPTATVAGTWFELDLTVRCTTPVSASVRRVGNHEHTHPVLPGTALLPEVTSRLRDVVGVDVPAAVAAGDLQVGDAVPSAEGKPAEPCPRGLFATKDPTADPDRSIHDVLGPAGLPPAQISELRARHAVVSGEGLLRPVEAPTSDCALTAVDDEKQRPTSEGGGPFTRSSIAAGTVLVSRVRVRLPAEPDRARLSEALDGPASVGAARRGDQGEVDLRVTDVRPGVPAISGHELTEGSTVIVEARSDLLLRDHALRWDPTPGRLAAELSVGGWRFAAEADDGTPLDSAWSVTRRDSWHGGWSLPRPSLVGVEAGSRAVLRVVTAGTPTDLADVLDRGVGERRGEGFGRVGIGAPRTGLRLGQNVVADGSATTAPVGAGDELGDAELRFLDSIRLAAVRERVRVRLAGPVDIPGLQGGGIGQSQLGGLRRAAVESATTASTEPLRLWLYGVRGTPKRAQLWPSKTLRAIGELIDAPERIWELLGMDPPGQLGDQFDHRSAETLGWTLAAAAGEAQRARDTSGGRRAEVAAGGQG